MNIIEKQYPHDTEPSAVSQILNQEKQTVNYYNSYSEWRSSSRNIYKWEENFQNLSV